MMRVCAWCNTVLEVVPSAVLSDDSITHGICEKCMNDVVAEYVERQSLREVLKCCAK